ncbi:hypothetical protein DPMN_012994 [Dreissena polymorpha]|uniref:Uncharacterized protein n=1 Tax=Dreissena polymorpha TaxID=45954 RepID=A0A9D4N834_DREPO|nr:hypothetical protein DPMN_012994 [Dreissena polymorpha]
MYLDSTNSSNAGSIRWQVSGHTQSRATAVARTGRKVTQSGLETTHHLARCKDGNL